MTNPWAAIIGPCYTTASLARALSRPEAEVRADAKLLRLLALETDDGTTLYPAFQLHDGHIVDGLEEVLRILQTGVADPWTWAQWLNTAVSDENPPRIIDALRTGDIDLVVLRARQDAASWSS